MGLRADDRVLQFASLGFDVVVEELFPTWLAGAAVVLAGGRPVLAAGAPRARIGRHGVTGLELPTAYWHEWTYDLAHGGGRGAGVRPLGDRGGRCLAPERLAEWAGLGVLLVHVFGLTETACTSTTLRLEAGEDGGRRRHNLPWGPPTATSGCTCWTRTASRSRGRAGRAVRGRAWVWPAATWGGRRDRRAVRPRPVRAAAGGAALRTGDRVRRWRTATWSSWGGSTPGQDPRLPHRDRRGGGRAHVPPGGARGLRPCAEDASGD